MVEVKLLLEILAALTRVAALRVPVVITLATILAALIRVLTRSVAVVISLANKLVAVALVDTKLDIVELVSKAFVPVMLVLSKFPIVATEILELFKFNVPALKFVATILVDVTLVEKRPADVTLVVNLAVPFTSSVVLGAIVFIPTFPLVVKIFPIVLELNVDVIPPVTKILPVVIPIENIAVVPPPPPPPPPPTNKTPF